VSGIEGLPKDLAVVLRDQSIVVRQDAAVFELIARWQNAPSNTASADGSGDDRPACAYCDGDAEVCNPGNASPGIRVEDWLYPVLCPRCSGTGKDPNP
jgi:hypothetical protein